MNNFSNHMSYSELILALLEALAQGRLLTRAEIGCVNSSVDEPLMKAVIERYPLRTTFKKLLGQSVERERALRPDLDLNVHSAAYGGERDKTALFLRTHFPAQPDIDVIARIKELVQRFIKANDATFNKQLLQAEKARLKEREREFEAGRLSSVRPAASLEAMKEDFLAYTEHLERSKQGRSTYAWETLSSLFHRIDTFAEGSPQRSEAECLLLSALDGARTAYHAYDKQYDVSGKDYTCPKGLEERLLDGHFFITAVELPSESPLSHFLDRLLTPFITYSDEMKGQGNPPACSELLYALYFEAAGYQKVQKAVHRYHLKDKGRIDSLRQQYVASLTPTAEQANITEEEKRQRELKDQRRVIPFNSAVGLLGTASCEELDEQYGEIITFLKSQDAIEQQEFTEETVTSPAQPKEHEAIVRAMLDSGHFMDPNHLYTVLAITGDYDFKTMQELTEKGKTPESYDESSIPTREELQGLHATYLGSEIGAFCHFYDEATINQRLANDQMHHSLSIAEPALCLWLIEDGVIRLSQTQKERLAVLCAKAGYSAAIRVLCSNMPGGHVSPNYVDSQERRSLLAVASNNGHTATACALMDAGADLNLQSNDGWTALMWASHQGHTDTARALLDAGADVNLRSDGWSALMWASYKGRTDIVRALLDAGADVNVQDRDDGTALMWASYNGHTDTARALIGAGANIDLRYGIAGSSALTYACLRGHIRIVWALLEARPGVGTSLVYLPFYCWLSSIDLQLYLIINFLDKPIKGYINRLLPSERFPILKIAVSMIWAVILGLIAGYSILVLAPPTWVYLMLQALYYKAFPQATPRLIAEKAFIQAAASQHNNNITLEHVNLNRFLVDGRNALEIALSHHNIPLVQTILAQESLASWVVLKALKEHFDVMFPLVLQHPKYERLLKNHQREFSPTQEHVITQRKALLQEIKSLALPVRFSGSGHKANKAGVVNETGTSSRPS